MKLRYLIICTATLATMACASNQKFKTASGPVDKTGVVERMLLNPHGDVDGLVLQDGTQIDFAPRRAGEIARAIGSKEMVKISGIQETDKLIHADIITNTRTQQVVANLTPPPPAPERPEEEERMNGAALDPMARPVPPRDHIDHMDHAGLKSLSATGTVRSQILGRRGEVNGVVLSDDTIVRFAPHIPNEATTNINIGEKLKASGYGTENSYGKAIEATEITN